MFGGTGLEKRVENGRNQAQVKNKNTLGLLDRLEVGQVVPLDPLNEHRAAAGGPRRQEREQPLLHSPPVGPRVGGL